MKGRFWKILAFSAALSISYQPHPMQAPGYQKADSGNTGMTTVPLQKDGFRTWTADGIILMPMATCCQILTPDGYRLGEDGAWVNDDPMPHMMLIIR